MLTENILHGPRIKLTAITRTDLPAISKWFENTSFSRMFDATPAFPKSEAQLEKWLEGVNKATDSYLFAIRLLENDTLLGYIELDSILWSHQSSWLSIGIGCPKYRGQGFGPGRHGTRPKICLQ